MFNPHQIGRRNWEKSIIKENLKHMLKRSIPKRSYWRSHWTRLWSRLGVESRLRGYRLRVVDSGVESTQHWFMVLNNVISIAESALRRRHSLAFLFFSSKPLHCGRSIAVRWMGRSSVRDKGKPTTCHRFGTTNVQLGRNSSSCYGVVATSRKWGYDTDDCLPSIPVSQK